MSTFKAANGLKLTCGNTDDGMWVASAGSSTPLRISQHLASILQWVVDDQRRPIDEYIGGPIAKEQLEAGVAILKEQSLIVDGDAALTPAAPARFRFHSLFSIQIAILYRDKHFIWLKALATKAFIRVLAGCAIVSFVVGLCGFLVYNRLYMDAISSPSTLLTLLATALFVVLANSLHELSHALALAYYGGNVRRIGVMLFYLAPAFFCDVTEAWHLPQKNQRTIVALAGVISSFGIAGVCSILFVVTGGAQQWLALAAVALFLTSVANLLPFIKLDGYIALMTYLDLPNLRSQSMHEWKLLVGTGVVSALRMHTASLPLAVFGLFCSGTPVVLLISMAVTLGRTSGSLITKGLVLIAIAAAIVLVIRGLYGVFQCTCFGVKSFSFRLFCTGILSALLLVVAALLPVPVRISEAYWMENGTVVTNMPPSKAAGHAVALYKNGLFLSQYLGSGVIGDEAIADAKVPLQALAPNVATQGYLGSASVLPITKYTGAKLSPVGSAVVEGGSEQLVNLILDFALS